VTPDILFVIAVAVMVSRVGFWSGGWNWWIIGSGVYSCGLRLSAERLQAQARQKLSYDDFAA